jgi:hypothetical protein
LLQWSKIKRGLPKVRPFIDSRRLIEAYNSSSFEQMQ